MWWLAFKMMLGDRSRLLLSLLAVAFAVVLVNLQGGLYFGLMRKASLLVDHGQADIWVGHRHMSNVDVGTYIPERWLQRVRSVEGVAHAQPYLAMFSEARMPDGKFEVVMVVGCDPRTLLGNAWSMAQGSAAAIREADAVLVDQSDLDRLGGCRLGDVREINGRRARVVGVTRNIVGFSTNPYVFTTLERARSRYLNNVPPGHCSYFLVKAQPGADLTKLAERIRARVPDLDVHERRTYSLMCTEYWLTRTGIGISFGLATVLGLLVGLAVVAQTLYAAVLERSREFATLKALGAPTASVAQVVIAQALGNAALGGLLGVLAALGIAALIDSPRAPVAVTWQVSAGSLLLIVAVCLAAAAWPAYRLGRLDPAGVLRS